MIQQTIGGVTLKQMVVAGAAVLDQHKKQIDALNVFPVPDGDTGTNMSLTIQSAVRESKSILSDDIGQVAHNVSMGALRGARGNSGVILSQLFRGFAKALEGLEEADAQQFASALKSGVDSAYKAVMKPKEGTILTVASHVAACAQEDAAGGKDIAELVANMITNGEEILAKTPDMLPVLKEAGVVDAGGKGLIYIYTGYKMALCGEEVVQSASEEHVEEADLADFGEEVSLDRLGNIKFAYCTEFFVERSEQDFGDEEIDMLSAHLQKLGDSVVCVGEGRLIKAHVHTNSPGKALQYGLALGEINGVKIDNMVDQNRKLRESRKAREKEYGIVAVSAGDGFAAIFKDIAVDELVPGGQSMNPSAEDIAKAAKKVRARNILIFPNNKNIILAAQQAKELVERETGASVTVFNSKSLPQGISAVLEFSEECSLEENVETMNAAMENVHCGQVTAAVRQAQYNGFSISEGDYIGMLDGDIVLHERDLDSAAAALLVKMAAMGDYITIFRGQDVTEEQAQALRDKTSAKYPDADVILQNGGQPLYHYVFSAE